MTSSAEFAKCVAEFISYDPVTGKYDQERARILAKEFGTDMIAPVEWADGTADPQRILRVLIMGFISEYKQRIAN